MTAIAWSTGDAGSSLTGLGPGVYSVKVTNEDGCEKTLTYVVSDPTALAISSTVTNNNCEQAGYDVDITVNGGNGDYSYTWNDGSTSEDRTGIEEGVYTVYVTDEN